MKASEMKEKLLANEDYSVEMMRNPANLNEWVVWIREPMGKSFLLTDELDEILATENANHCLFLLKSLGVKKASIVL